MSGYLGYQFAMGIVPDRMRPYVRVGLREMMFIRRRITSPHRSLPDFVIIGAHKAGTTSLFEYLCQHNSVLTGPWKETRFFDKYYGQGIDWYRAFFPLKAQCTGHEAGDVAVRRLTGEATPEYLFDPRVPARIHHHLPNVRLIVVLRDPRYRAYSDYQHQIDFGWNPAPTFRCALKDELNRMAAMNGGPPDEWYDSDDAAHSYLWRGHYAEQLERWLAYFPRERIHVLRTEELKSDPTRVARELEQFLDIPHCSSARLGRLNTREDRLCQPIIGDRRRSTWRFRDVARIRLSQNHEYTSMDPAALEFMTDYFASHNRRLSQLLGATFTW